MNPTNPTPPPIAASLPPQLPPAAPPPHGNAPGDEPGEREPIGDLFAAVEAILRQPRRVMFQVTREGSRPLIAGLLLIAVLSVAVYGLVAGTFSGGAQLWAAPIKLAAGLVLTALICLPSLYIFACLSGSQARLMEVIGLVAGMLALMTMLLIGFAPVAWVFSQSTESVGAMGALHLIFLLVALCFGVRFLCSSFERHSPESESGPIGVWVVIFLLVALQMTTALRPIVGTAETFLPAEKKFFASHWYSTVADTPAKTPRAEGRR
ncbi:MAG: hypothetical protein FJ386_10415 [Verrucomicrobia bacterium]|nr:hypothetical protein [Verrucomicrobiota bacterium]